MTSTTLPSPADLDARLEALADAMAEAEQEITRLSLPASGGDADAIAALTKAHAKIVSLQRDHEILQRARTAALTQAEAASEAEAEAARAAAKAKAIELARLLQQDAARIDALADEYRELVQAVAKNERALHAALRAAGEPCDGGRIGQEDLGRYAVAVIDTALAAPAFRARPCGLIAGTAWGYLTDKAPA